MGTSRTPRYVARYRTQEGWSEIVWNVRASTNITGHGMPTEANAEKMRASLNRSFNVGGVNEHVSRSAGFILHVSEVRVCLNLPNRPVVAVAKAPLFEVN